MWEKTILKAGSGINLPNKLATVTVDVEGTWRGVEGASTVFDQRSDALVKLGAFYLELFFLA